MRKASTAGSYGLKSGDIEEREGSRVAVIFPGHHPVVFHRPHPSPVTDKGAVTAIRKWLARMDLKP